LYEITKMMSQYKRRFQADLGSSLPLKQKRIRQEEQQRREHRQEKRKMSLVDDIDVIEIDLDEITLDPFTKKKRTRHKRFEAVLLTGRLSSECRELTMERKQQILFIRQQRLKFYGLM